MEPMPLHPKDLKIADYVYELPDERIAKFPLAQRDQSKLLYYKQGEIADHQFQEISDLLPENSLLLFNDTKVVQARLFFTRPTGSVVEIFCLEPVEPTSEIQQAMQQTGSCVWRCMVGNAKKWKEPELTLNFTYAGKNAILKAEKTAQGSRQLPRKIFVGTCSINFCRSFGRCRKFSASALF